MTDTIPAGALVADAAPYIVAVAGVVVPTLVGLALNELRRLTGLKIQQGAADKLDSLIEDKIGGLVAADARNLATATITIDHPMVAGIANAIIAEAPDALAAAGVTPAAVAGMAHGEIGRWQAGMTRVAPAAAS